MITIIDAIMGVGKTTYIIDEINRQHQCEIPCLFQSQPPSVTNYLIVVPLLTEVQRIQTACPGLQFVDPQPSEGRKLNHLRNLIDQRANICTTHALFLKLSQDIYGLLKQRKYILVIDEALDCVHPYNGITDADLRALQKNNYVYVENETNRLQWNHCDHGAYRGRFADIKSLCDNGNLIHFRNRLLWEFPVDFLRCFEEVHILTYLFFGSPMSAHLRAAGIDYSHKTLRDGELVSWQDGSEETEIKAKLRDLVTIFEGQMNDVGFPMRRNNPLSSSWFDNRSDGELAAMKASAEHFFKKIAKTPASQNGWTTFKKGEKRLKGARYSRGFIPVNTKATNDHIETRSLAYLCNIFPHPLVKGYFEERGISIDQELYALSEMLQWIWRSQIRRGDPITLYIPSERMRNLLKKWLAADSPVALLPTPRELRAAA